MPQPRVWLNYFFSPLDLSNKRQLDKDKKNKNKRRKEMQREREREGEGEHSAVCTVGGSAGASMTTALRCGSGPLSSI
jgi:hypothetical protein